MSTSSAHELVFLLEKLIADMQQQQQDVMEVSCAWSMHQSRYVVSCITAVALQDHATAATSLSSATAEAENAEEVAAFLAAELHQLQIEVAVKQVQLQPHLQG